MNNASNESAIKAERIRHLLTSSNASLFANLFLASILAYTQLAVINFTVVGVWFFLIALCTLYRAILVRVYLSRAGHVKNVIAWFYRFRYGVLCSGVIWGSAAFVMFPAEHVQHQMFLLFMLAGLTAGIVVTYSADIFSATAYSVLVVAPIATRLMIQGDYLSLAMSASSTLYLGFMLVSAHNNNRNINENIALRFAASANELTIKTNEERYRLLLDHSPVGIFHFDTDLIITYCNNRFAQILQNTPDNIIGQDIKRIRDQALTPTLRKALQGEMAYYQGWYHATLNDAKVWADVTCAPLKEVGGKLLGGIGIVQDITERKAAEEEIKSLAFYDSLTGLPNRRLLLERLRHALATSERSGREGALLFIDLDHFKTLNDTLGHDIGDQLLIQVAERLNSCVREGDTVARLGGDEYVVMLEDLNEHELEAATQVEIVGDKILSILNAPYQLGTHEYRNTPSIGATLFNAHHTEMVGIKEGELLKQADIAMYQAKKSGRNTLRFFDPQTQAGITARVALETSLRSALAENQFKLCYQPQVHQNQQIIGAEVLIRWQHPQRGMVSPVDFIPLAEETGLIVPIGLWVLKTACAQLKKWETKPMTQHLQLAVNVSARQFHQPDFVDQVRQTLDTSAINPNKLKLELTESLVLDDVDDTIAKMNRLREMGVRFSMDDFGTGHSSLTSLKKLPLDQLKIDQSFVRDITVDQDNAVIVQTIIAMGNNLGMEVIAEGVETEIQRAFLEQHGCLVYQGYLFSKPVPIEQFELFFNQSHSSEFAQAPAQPA